MGEMVLNLISWVLAQGSGDTTHLPSMWETRRKLGSVLGLCPQEFATE